MMLPPVPKSPEDEKPSLRDHTDLQKGDIDSFEADLQESNTDCFEHGDDPMPPSFQNPTLSLDSVQNIPELDGHKSQVLDDWDDLETNEKSYYNLKTNEDVYRNIPSAQVIPKASHYEHSRPLSQPLAVSQESEETYGDHSETTGEILHSSLHQRPLPLPPRNVPRTVPYVRVNQQPIDTLSEYTPLLTLPVSEDYEFQISSDILPDLPARQPAQKQVPPLKLIPPVQFSTTRPPPSPPPRTTSLQPITEDSDSTADDPYLAFSMDLESLDISKLTLEQLEQIDPRQAQIWMLLKMHQMIRKVEDVYESAEQLYSIRQATSPIPKKLNMQDNRKDNQFGTQHYENTLQPVKRPVPKPRQNIARNRSEQGDPSTIQELCTNTSEEIQQESELVKDKPKTMYRQQKIIGKHVSLK